MERIVILANKYPNRVEPMACVFIQQLVWTFADLGMDCIVIAPLPVNLNAKYLRYAEEEIEITENHNVVKVYHPKYISLGQCDGFAQKGRVLFTTKKYERTVERALNKLGKKPDYIYSHFLCPSGVVAARLGRKYNIPSYFAHGEALYSGDKKYGNNRLKRELSNINGVVAVSTQNKNYITSAGIVEEKKVDVFPNGFREERFYPRDKNDSRLKFGLPLDAFIIGMCGSFDERKGVLRIESAVDQLDDVKFICAGKGELMPSSENCLFAKPVRNEELPWFYSALDVFVLPTQNEGCCNAIVEAIACGCPIVSSDRNFNVDICDNTNSILVDPDNVDQIKEAISKIKEDSHLREKLSEGSIEKSKSLTLKQRAVNILDFIKSKANYEV